MAFLLLSRLGMTLPNWPHQAPAITLFAADPSSDATVRRAPPPALLLLSRGDDDRPTTPVPSVTRTVVPRRRWISLLFAAAMVAGGVSVANVLADAPEIAR